MKVPTVTSVDDDSRSRKRKDNSECGPDSNTYDPAGSFYDIQVSKPNATGCRSISFKNKKRY